MKQGLKTLVLMIIFGVPVLWYLFLQLFGTNQFELQKLGAVQDACVTDAISILILDEAVGEEQVNQYNRIMTNAFISPLTRLLLESFDCLVEQWDYILVDSRGDIYGMYLYDIEDVDRLITEVELLQLKKEQEKDGI